jgi:succinylglutamic semialdehyde dehydrogenase
MSMTQDIVSFDPARPSVEVSRVRVDAGAVDAAVHAARAAFPAWSARSMDERAALLQAWSAACARHAERIAVAIMRETGKVLAEARQEAALLSDKVAVTLEEREPLTLALDE